MTSTSSPQGPLRATQGLLRMTLATGVATCLLITGCGEFSYKRGAGIAGLNQAKRHCEAEKASDDAGLAACLEHQGWFVGNFDKTLDQEDPVIHAVYREDPRGPASSAATVDSAPAAAPTAALVNTKNPLDIFLVSSWWKPGAGAAGLQVDTASCVAQLGEAHKPDRASGKASRGLLLCMRRLGWHALQAN